MTVFLLTGRVSDHWGRAVVGATVSILEEGTATPVQLYSDRGDPDIEIPIPPTPTSNPRVSDSEGRYSFYLDEQVIDADFVATGHEDRSLSGFNVNRDRSGSLILLADTTVTADIAGVVNFSNEIATDAGWSGNFDTLLIVGTVLHIDTVLEVTVTQATLDAAVLAFDPLPADGAYRQAHILTQQPLASTTILTASVGGFNDKFDEALAESEWLRILDETFDQGTNPNKADVDAILYDTANAEAVGVSTNNTSDIVLLLLYIISNDLRVDQLETWRATGITEDYSGPGGRSVEFTEGLATDENSF